jgi:hypothetical protein
MHHLVPIFAASFLMLAGVAEAAGAAPPAVPIHEIPLPSFEPPKIVGQPIRHPVAAAPVPPVNLGEAGWLERLWTDPIATFSMAVALFALALATFSYFQLRPLRHTASAARDSAAALPALERAYVFLTVEGTNIEPVLLEARANIGAEMAPMTVDGLSVHYRYENHGNTPAVIRAASVEFAHLTLLPSDLRYRDTPVDDEIVIRGGEANPRDKAETRYLTTPLTQEDVIRLSNGDSFLWFYGHIAYDDIFGKDHETAFCWYYDGLAKSFYQYGGRRYNYRT